MAGRVVKPLTRKQVSVILNRNPKTVSRLKAEGRLKSYHPADVRAFMIETHIDFLVHGYSRHSLPMGKRGGEV